MAKRKNMEISKETRLKLSVSAKKYWNSVPHPKMSIEEKRKKAREYIARLKKDVFEVLGNKCIRCNFNDPRALQIDHIDGGGVRELTRKNPEKKYKGHYYNHVKNTVLSGVTKYQLLCANCNWIKRVENGENLRYLNKNNEFEAMELSPSDVIYREIGI